LESESFSLLARREAPLRSDDETYIALAHRKDHVQGLRQLTEQVLEGHRHIDGDTVVSPGTWEAARRAVGAGLDAVDQVIAREASNAFCQVRPPGHHAESHRAMGFCLFNNIAIAAHYARKRHGLERVAVVDFDVHHGNGTQDIFWSDKTLFYGSTHQMPLFPGTGALRETGVGNIFNAPLRAGDAREHFEEAFRDRILGPLHNFAPDLLLISAGFDAHHRDPLGGLRLVEDDFRWATEALAEVARRHANGRIVSMLEGGYDLTGLARSVAAHVTALMQAGD
jgi:acetoin utilization deacetylase AcuC-like enzyme